MTDRRKGVLVYLLLTFGLAWIPLGLVCLWMIRRGYARPTPEVTLGTQ